MGQTIVEKIAQSHLAEGSGSGAEVKAGAFVSLRPDHILTHDNTAPVMGKFASLGAGKVHDPRQPVYALDHDIQNRSEENLGKYKKIESFAREQGVDFYPAGTGIGHQVMVEKGYVLPGSLVVASDSHSNMYGALGALGTPVVRTDAAAVWAVGTFWWQVPETVQVVLEGELPLGVSGKDLILALTGLYPKEVLNKVVELAGPGVASLSMDARLAIANMSTEWGSLAAWFPVDEVTVSFLEQRRAELDSGGVDRISEADLLRWRETPPVPDPDAAYSARIELDLAEVSPQVAGPDSVQAVRSLAEVERDEIPVHKAYLLSCVNGRYEDLEQAARVLEGKTVATGVELYVAAASRRIQDEAERSGVWETLMKAGATALPPSCGPCIGLGTGLLEPNQVGISATNRNFKGRMGSRDARCFLASPAVVAASAAAGRICGPEEAKAEPPARRYTVLEQPSAASAERTEIIEGFPAERSGRLVLVPADNLNTDGIYGKELMYREGVTREQMAAGVMRNYDPSFAERTGEGDVLVGGKNFGTGSSREQAVTALQHRGIAMVVAASFSQTYLRNAFNNGFLCIACPDFVARARAELAVAEGEKTVIPGDILDVSFRDGTITWRGESFAFPPLGPVPQSLVVAGGVENLVRKQLGLA